MLRSILLPPEKLVVEPDSTVGAGITFPGVGAVVTGAGAGKEIPPRLGLLSTLNGESALQIEGSQKQGESSLHGPCGTIGSASNPGKQQGCSVELEVTAILSVLTSHDVPELGVHVSFISNTNCHSTSLSGTSIDSMV